MQFRKGNLLDANERYIAHGCNAQGVMGSGVALAIKEKWPEAYLEYVRHIKKYRNAGVPAVGTYCYAKVVDKVIINLITQEFYGRDSGKYVSYDALDASIQSLSTTLFNKEIAIPKIGAGLGGGHWSIIRSIFEYYEKKFNNEFIVYEL